MAPKWLGKEDACRSVDSQLAQKHSRLQEAEVTLRSQEEVCCALEAQEHDELAAQLEQGQHLMERLQEQLPECEWLGEPSRGAGLEASGEPAW